MTLDAASSNVAAPTPHGWTPAQQALWAPSMTGFFATLPDVWSTAWAVARQNGQGGQHPPIDALLEVWTPFQKAWAQRPDAGLRFAWSAGRKGWAPTIKALVQGGLLDVASLEKPRPDQPPLRLAETLMNDHPALFRWLVEQGEPAEAPWGDGSRSLRSTMHAQPHKKVARLWLQRPEENTPYHLGDWLATTWERGHGTDVQALVWNAWDAVLSTASPEDRALHEHRAAHAWADRIVQENGWPGMSGLTMGTDSMGRQCWARWKTVLGDGVLENWKGLLQQRMASTNPPPLTPGFVNWFNGEVEQAFRRYERAQLRQAVAAVAPEEAAPATARTRTRL